MNAVERNGVFICHDARDAKWLEKLRKTLVPIERQRKFTAWDRTMIRPGQRRNEQVEAAISTARVAVLLVSQNFFASRHIQDYELPLILGAARDNALTLIWIAVEPARYTGTEIENYHSPQDPSKPLSSLDVSPQNNALLVIGKAIEDALGCWAEPTFTHGYADGFNARREVAIKMMIPLEDFLRQREPFRNAVAEFLRISPHSVRYVSIASGSATATIELPDESAEKLFKAYKSKKPELERSLAPFAVVAVQKIGNEVVFRLKRRADKIGWTLTRRAQWQDPAEMKRQNDSYDLTNKSYMRLSDTDSKTQMG